MAPLARPNRAASLTYNCDFHDHQCTRLTSCTYFENLIQKGVDALTVGQELRRLFCGFDGFDILICCPLSSLNHSFSTIPPMIEIHPAYDDGFANSHGIVFASMNSHGPISQPIPIAPSHIPKPGDSSLQSSDVNNVLDFNSNYSPYNPVPSPVHEVPAKPQSSFSSSGFTFAPLLAATSLPASSQPTVNSTSYQMSIINSMIQEENHKPSSSTVPSVIQQSPISSPNHQYFRSQCGITNYTSSRVVGGTITQIGQYPWIAALGYSLPNLTTNGLQFYCAGSLITRSHILTSAHCISPFLRVARLGEYDLSRENDGANPIDFGIERTIVHEEYLPDIILNDIAILKLKRQAPVNDKIRPICLPLFEPLRSADLTGYTPFVAGWGSTFFQGPQSSILQDTQVPIVSTGECEKSYKAIFSTQVFDNRIICAGNGAHDACQGDSGGPLMVSEMSDGDAGFHYVLVGIVSYGYECARDGFPGVYTRISTFLPWIQRNLS
ncbi:proclotting enzyme isoform X2 [Sitodiplosis mosellana]|uniref:proclotting enzyme isoform X2 n=1 Tax=Sitodiplosis mosellana TaxID=263140 RepID=UPI0024446886|nr:proclotting enzyme isoform X2 [Sitodiplosis mosellana]